MNNIKTSSVELQSSFAMVLNVCILSLLVVTAFMAVLPKISNAATYFYVDSADNFKYIQANSSADAFINSTNIATNSGVMLMSGPVSVNQLEGYLYVNTSGRIMFVASDTSAEAFTDSTNISTHSGVMLISNMLESNMVGDQVVGF